MHLLSDTPTLGMGWRPSLWRTASRKVEHCAATMTDLFHIAEVRTVRWRVRGAVELDGRSFGRARLGVQSYFDEWCSGSTVATHAVVACEVPPLDGAAGSAGVPPPMTTTLGPFVTCI